MGFLGPVVYTSRTAQGARANDVQRVIKGFRDKRHRLLDLIGNMIANLVSSNPEAPDGAEQLTVSKLTIEKIAAKVAEVDPLYDTLLAAPPLRSESLDAPRKLAYDALQELRKQEN